MSKIAVVIQAVLVLLYTSNQAKSSDPVDPPLRYVKGVYELPEAPSSIPVIYDNFFPVIYEFHLPKWNAETMKIQFWKNHNNCSESDNYSDGYPCPIMHHMNNLIDYFVGNLTVWKNLFLDVVDENTPSHIHGRENPDLKWPLLFSHSTSQIVDLDFYCSQITPHFSTFQTSPEKLGEYYKMMEQCGNDTVKRTMNVSSTAENLEILYHDTFASFVGSYWDKMTKIPQQASAVTTWTALETTLMVHQFMETQKWSGAIASCQQGQIPWTLIDHDSITEAIQSNEHSSQNSQKYQLAIPLTEMSKYYKLPLTDCVFVGQEILVVRVLIPRKLIALNPYRIIRFEPVVFHENGQFCWIEETRNKRFIADDQNNLYNTECSDQSQQRLCKISNDHYSSHDPCVQALYQDLENEIVESCSLKCIPTDKSQDRNKYFNFAHTHEDSFVYAVAEDQPSLRIECDGKEPQIIPKLDFGAWNLTLSCGCELIGLSSVNYRIQPPCNNDFILEKIRPYHWRKLSLVNNKVESNEIERSPSEYEEIKGDDIFAQHLDERFRSYQMNYMLLWAVMLVITIVLAIIGYMVFKLYQWKQQETYRENRLIYNVRDNGDNISMERQQPRY